jgi:hypothetical protein
LKKKQELLRLRFEEQARKETRKAADFVIESNLQGGLKPWREIVTPHPDVASGCYQEAEFAADLWQVYLVVSIPASDIEVGGDRGKEALNRKRLKIKLVILHPHS